MVGGEPPVAALAPIDPGREPGLPTPPARNGLDVQVAIQPGQVVDFTRPLRAGTPFRRLAKVDVEGSVTADRQTTRSAPKTWAACTPIRPLGRPSLPRDSSNGYEVRDLAFQSVDLSRATRSMWT